MISKKELKKFLINNFSKKIGKEAMDKIEEISVEFIHELLRKASKKADFSGRTTIKPQDLTNYSIRQ